MAAFDDPRVSDGPFANAGRVLLGQPGTFVAAITAVAVMCGVSLVLIALASQVVERFELERNRIQASVYLDPGLARADAEALKSQLDALPVVRSAVLRTREAALNALADAGLPALRDKPNPLPDVWIVSLAPGFSPRGGDETLATRVAAARTSLAALPNVVSVRIDDHWVGLLDASSSTFQAAVQVVAWGGGVLLSGGLFCVAFLTGRALTPGRTRAAEKRPVSTASAVIVGAVVAVVGLAAGMLWASASLGDLPNIVANAKPMTDLIGQSGIGQLVGMAAIVGLGIAIAGCALGNRRHSRIQ